MATNDFFKVVVASPIEILDTDFRIRYKHFITRNHNRPEDLQVIFYGGVLYFPDSTPEKDIAKFTELFGAVANQKYLDGKRQEARLNAISDRFGKDGERTALDMYDYHKSVVLKK